MKLTPAQTYALESARRGELARLVSNRTISQRTFDVLLQRGLICLVNGVWRPSITFSARSHVEEGNTNEHDPETIRRLIHGS